MGKYILLLLCILGGAISLGYVDNPFGPDPQNTKPKNTTEPVQVATKTECGHKVIMYSQTNCGVCKQIKKRLIEARIPYQSYDIDRSPSLQKSVGQRAIKAGMRTIHIPMFEVGGKFLSGRTSMDTLKQHLCQA